MLFVSHDRHFLAALSNRVLELTPEGPHVYGGGYTRVRGADRPRGARAAELKRTDAPDLGGAGIRGLMFHAATA